MAGCRTGRFGAKTQLERCAHELLWSVAGTCRVSSSRTLLHWCLAWACSPHQCGLETRKWECYVAEHWGWLKARSTCDKRGTNALNVTDKLMCHKCESWHLCEYMQTSLVLDRAVIPYSAREQLEWHRAEQSCSLRWERTGPDSSSPAAWLSSGHSRTGRSPRPLTSDWQPPVASDCGKTAPQLTTRKPQRSEGPFTQDALAHLHANLRANPLMLLASCVNTPIDHNVFHNLFTHVARWSASCVNWA